MIWLCAYFRRIFCPRLKVCVHLDYYFSEIWNGYSVYLFRWKYALPTTYVVESWSCKFSLFIIFHLISTIYRKNEREKGNWSSILTKSHDKLWNFKKWWKLWKKSLKIFNNVMEVAKIFFWYFIKVMEIRKNSYIALTKLRKKLNCLN